MKKDRFFSEVTEPCKSWPSIEDYIKALGNPLESLQRLKRFKPFIHPDGSLDYWNDNNSIVFHMIDSMQANYQFGLECCLNERYWKSFLLHYKPNDDIRIYQDEVCIEFKDNNKKLFPVILHREYDIHESTEQKHIKSSEKEDNCLILSEDRKTLLLWNDPNSMMGKFHTCVSIPEGIENIADGAFVGCQNMSKVCFPSSLKKIGNFAFADCGFFAIISKAQDIDEIGEYAFLNCTLKYIPQNNGLPWSIRKINKNSFRNTIVDCNRNYYTIDILNNRNGWKVDFKDYPDNQKLVEIDYDKLLSHYVEDSDGVVYDSSYRYILKCNNKELERYKVRDSTIGILKEAFTECSNLKEIDLSHVEYIAERAFCDCKSLIDIRFSNTLQAIGRGAFISVGLERISLPNSLISIGEDAFNGCKKLKEIIINSDLEELPARVFFGCRLLTHISLNNNLKIIGRKAFGNCISLTSIVLPPSIRKLGELCFEGSSLTEIKLPKNLIAMDDSPFCGCKNIKISSESPFFFANKQFLLSYNKTRLVSYLLDEINIVIPGTVKVLLGYSLSNKKNAKRIYLPNSVEYIGHWAFRDTHAECVNFPKSIFFIKSSFDYCASIKKYLINNIKLLEGKSVTQPEIIEYK